MRGFMFCNASQDGGGKLQTVVPVLTLADFPDAAQAARHLKAVILAYPRTSAVIIREAGILCWGLMANTQVWIQAQQQSHTNTCQRKPAACMPARHKIEPTKAQTSVVCFHADSACCA